MLSSDTVLTAAHCQSSTSRFQVGLARVLFNQRIHLIQVVVGEHDVTQSDGAEQRITPRYDERRRNVYRDRVNIMIMICKLRKSSIL